MLACDQANFIDKAWGGRVMTSFSFPGRGHASETLLGRPADASSRSPAADRFRRRAASIFQPDLCHADGITECRLNAGTVQPYHASIAPHNPLGPISLAAGVQLAASIPNFLCQEQLSLGEGYLKKAFMVRDGYLDLPSGPGPGIELDENAMADKIGDDWKAPESQDADDGSVVDW
jgi:galactonate dehydratase